MTREANCIVGTGVPNATGPLVGGLVAIVTGALVAGLVVAAGTLVGGLVAAGTGALVAGVDVATGGLVGGLVAAGTGAPVGGLVAATGALVGGLVAAGTGALVGGLVALATGARVGGLVALATGALVGGLVGEVAVTEIQSRFGPELSSARIMMRCSPCGRLTVTLSTLHLFHVPNPLKAKLPLRSPLTYRLHFLEFAAPYLALTTYWDVVGTLTSQVANPPTPP